MWSYGAMGHSHHTLLCHLHMTKVHTHVVLLYLRYFLPLSGKQHYLGTGAAFNYTKCAKEIQYSNSTNLSKGKYILLMKCFHLQTGPSSNEKVL